MRRSIRTSLVGLLVASVAGCMGNVGGTATGTGNGTGMGTGNAGTTGGPGNAGASGTAGTSGNAGITGNPGTAGVSGIAGASGTAGTTGSTCTGTCVCMPGIPATTQMPRMTRLQYDTVIRDLLGVTTLASNGNQPPSALLADDSAGALTDIAWNGYLGAAEKIATEVIASTTNKPRFIACDPAAAGTAGTTCLTNTIRTFGRKAFRRPLTDAEVTSFMRFSPA